MRNALLSALLLLPAAASAQTVERFRMEKTESGYVRMDTRTGAMSTCAEQDGQLVCRMAADDRLALEDETERLRGELERLEARVTALEGRPAVSLPTDADIDRTLGVVERLFRGFAGMARDWAEEERQGGGLAPDRT